MNLRSWLPLPLVVAATALLTWQVHARLGDETIRCPEATATECMVGSSASWLLTGITMTAPLLLHLGWRWSARLYRQKKLDPLRRMIIPDYEEIIEIIVVIATVAASVWLVRNGPQFRLVEGGFPNSWLGGSLGMERGQTLVPTRGIWFAVGALVSAPFSFSLGSAISREWFGRKRRRSAAANAESTEADVLIDLDEADEAIVESTESA